MPNDLLPCPFCGSPAEATMPLKPTLDEALTSNDRDAKCSLPKCVGRYVHCRVDEWNRRAHSPAVRDLVEAARQAQRRATDEIVRDSLRKAIAPFDREGKAT